MSILAPDTDGLAAAVNALRDGRLVAFPTETVYGLGADARDPKAVARIFATKGRPADHPLIVHLADAGWLDDWAREVPEAARRLAAAFWPGPMALVLPRAAGVPDAVTGGLDTVALRVPGHPVARALLRAFGSGIAAPSANRYGRVSPTAAEHVAAEFGEAVPVVLDGGRCAVGIESTIIDLSRGAPRILRPGAVTAADVERVLAQAAPDAGAEATPAPGRKPSHYAPDARVELAEAGASAALANAHRGSGRHVGLLAARRPEGLHDDIAFLALAGDAAAQARGLYQRLRDADALGLDVLIAELPPDEGMGHALRDRLRRAAGLGDGTLDDAP